MVAVSGINWNGRYDFYYPTNTEVFDIQFEESVATFYCQNGSMTQEFKIDHAVGGFLQGMPYVCGGKFKFLYFFSYIFHFQVKYIYIYFRSLS